MADSALDNALMARPRVRAPGGRDPEAFAQMRLRAIDGPPVDFQPGTISDKAGVSAVPARGALQTLVDVWTAIQRNAQNANVPLGELAPQAAKAHDRAVASLRTAKKTVDDQARFLRERIEREALPRPDNHLSAEIRAAVSVTPGKAKQLALQDPRVAGAIAHGPAFLSGLDPDTQASIRAAAIRAHPEHAELAAREKASRKLQDAEDRFIAATASKIHSWMAAVPEGLGA
ncbi:MAG: hypothetical protein AAFX08_09260 [Pseudomonadota bacterium]